MNRHPGVRYHQCECGSEFLTVVRDVDSPSKEECLGVVGVDQCENMVPGIPATTEQYDRLKEWAQVV